MCVEKRLILLKCSVLNRFEKRLILFNVASDDNRLYS